VKGFGGGTMRDYMDDFKEAIVKVLSLLMAFVVLLATIDLIGLLIGFLIYTTPYTLKMEELISFFGSILLILIGVELLETISTYHFEKIITVKMVLLVAMIAIARKIILLELDDRANSEIYFGISAIILALSAGYYLIVKSSCCMQPKE
jgi:uncharacterized membrane protein (DUF373 family)